MEQTIAIARKQWQLAKQKIRSEEAEISSAYEELLENETGDVKDLNSKQGFDNLASLSQYVMPVTAQIAAHETVVQSIQTLVNIMDSPYFARIDFKYDGEETLEKIYIGRATLMEQDTYTILVHDWRAPVSSVFYRFGIGEASFITPGGTVHGEVSLKRQYEIRRGDLLYFFDADVQILDEFLRQLLSGHASSKMKTIVETIQRDQDIVIRDMQSDVLMVQGAAGSGKTSIALHRIAYLLYQGLSGRLDANDILILSPNSIFEEYISHVLPDLGENNVKTMLFEDIFKSILRKVQIHSKGQCMERLLACQDEKQAALMKDSIAFKGSEAFVLILDRLVKDLPKRWIAFRDIDYNGQCIAKREQLKAAICNSRKKASLGMRLRWLERDILERVHAMHGRRIKKLTQFAMRYPDHAMELEAFARWISIRESSLLLREIRSFSEIDTIAVYRRLFSDRQLFYSLAEGISLPDNIEDIHHFACDQLTGDRLWHDDAEAVMYLHIRIHGCGVYTHYRQVVLDEAQDASVLYFAILRELFSGARYTILGDVNQTIGKQADVSLYRQIEKMLGRERTMLATMEKSFRCTMEIWRFSARFLEPGTAGQCFSRTGDEPAILNAAGTDSLDDMIAEEVAACRGKGYQSIGLICKTERDAVALHNRLSEKVSMKLIRNGIAADISGVVILPIYLAKGLEFDAVLVLETDRDHYHAEDDKRLLYIACTRALHRLNLFYTGEISPLLMQVSE